MEPRSPFAASAASISQIGRARTIYVPPDEIRTPIEVVTLGRAWHEPAGAFRGHTHLAGSEAVDCVSLTRRLAARLGFSPDAIIARSAEEIDGRAPRPREVSLDNAGARDLLNTPMRDFDSAMDLVLEVARSRETRL